MTPSAQKKKVAALLSTEEDLLFLKLGRTFASPLGAKSPTKVELTAKAKAWFRKKRRYFRNRICRNERFKSFLARDFVETSEIVLAISALLAPPLQVPQALLVGALIVRRGITKLCGK